MQTKIEEALIKLNSLIEKRKEDLDLGEATIHQYDDGGFVHYFKTWEEYYGGSLMKPIKKMGEYPKDKIPLMVFAKKGLHIPLVSFPAKKTYVVIRGRIDYFFEDDSVLELTDFCSMVVEKNKLHGGVVRKDTFVMIIEDELTPLS